MDDKQQSVIELCSDDGCTDPLGDFDYGSEAANDLLEAIELRRMDSSAGHYERVGEIRRWLRLGDAAIAVGLYGGTLVLAYIVLTA